MGTWLQIVKETVTTQEVLDKYIGKPNRYNRGKYICPFHGDKNPSISINPKNGRFKCFGCGASGDAVDFVEMFYKCDQKKALEILNDDFNLRFENCKKDNDDRINQIKIRKQREELKKQKLELSISYFTKRIKTALKIASDIYTNNGPEKNNDLEQFKNNEQRVQKCMWAVYQMEYLVWLENCLGESPYSGDVDYSCFQFDIGVLGKMPYLYEKYITNDWQENLTSRKFEILEKLKTGELGIYANKYY